MRVYQNSESNENPSSKLEEVPEGRRSVPTHNMLKNKELRVFEFTHSPLPALSAAMGCASLMAKQVLPLVSACTIGLT